MENKLSRKYGLFTAICMVVGIVIGSGVFFKAQTILQRTGGDMITGIIAWIIGGAIMLVCLLTFAFMGQKYEKVNGLVDYAEATMGKSYGYYMGWFATTIYYPGMTSALAWLSARYTLVFLEKTGFPLLTIVTGAKEIIVRENETGGEILDYIEVSLLDGPIGGPECLALAACYLCVIYAINALAPKLAGKFQTTTTVIKLIPLALMAVVGLIVGIVSGVLPQNMTTVPTPEELNDLKVVVSASPLLAGVSATAFAYEGWIIATSINSEIKDSKKNLPKALILGGIIIIAVYLLYFIGVAGGADTKTLIGTGASAAFINVFGNIFGNVLNLFVAISCLGTLNGLMVGATRGMYTLSARNDGPAPKVFGTVDKHTNMATNSAVIGLVVTAIWLLYFFLSNLAGTWGGIFAFDSTELPIITIYAMYLPMFVAWMVKEKDQSVLRRFIMPILACGGSVFMVYSCVAAHGWKCVGYLIVFAVIMLIGALLRKVGHKKLETEEE